MAPSAPILFRRSSGGGVDQKVVIVVLVIVIAIIALSIFLYIRRTGRFGRELAKRRRGTVKKRTWREAMKARFGKAAPVRADVRDSAYSATAAQDVEEDADQGVDRHTSVRSVMTLPAYSAAPRDGEGVLGREGERAGMDTVIEFPETVDEEEIRREDEMESLYQIRLQRRQETADRNDRRTRRREARARGDTVMLRQMRRESMLRRTEREETGSAAMFASHESRPKERRVSAVSYGDLGVARHDGSRVRANSNESDRPLLDAAGSHGTSGAIRPWMSRESLGSHYRTQSSSSMISLSSMSSDDRSVVDEDRSDYEVVSLQPTSSRPHSRSRNRSHSRTTPGTPGTRSRGTSLSQVLTLDTDVGDARIPMPEPPRYDGSDFEEAPPYESPVRTRTPPVPQIPASYVQGGIPQLPAIQRLPSIRITEGTPIEARSAFPDFETYGGHFSRSGR